MLPSIKKVILTTIIASFFSIYGLVFNNNVILIAAANIAPTAFSFYYIIRDIPYSIIRYIHYYIIGYIHYNIIRHIQHIICYIHTHTLCGSAPSLIEMIVCRVPIFSIDVVQNRYTLSTEGSYFKDFDDLHSMIASETIPKIPSQEFAMNYNWKSVVTRYEMLI